MKILRTPFSVEQGRCFYFFSIFITGVSFFFRGNLLAEYYQQKHN